MKKVYPLLLLYILLGFVPISFTDCNCKCPPSGPDEVHRILSLSINTQYNTSIIDTSSFYSYDSISKYIFIDKSERISFNKSYAPFSLTNTAFACDCVVPEQKTENHITNISITSKNDIAYTDTVIFSKDSSLNQYFNVAVTNRSGRFSIPSFLKTFKAPSSLQENISLYLNSKPSNNVTVLFDLEVTLSDGKKFLFENQSLKVK